MNLLLCFEKRICKSPFDNRIKDFNNNNNNNIIIIYYLYYCIASPAFNFLLQFPTLNASAFCTVVYYTYAIIPQQFFIF
jgi:hypothetical protein